MRTLKRPVLSALLVAVPLLAACGAKASKLAVQGVWSRPTATGDGAASLEHDHGGDRTPGAAYLSIVNTGGRSDRLLAVRSPVCAAAEIHETLVHGDRVRMRPVAGGVAIPAHATVELEPGGLHVMLTGMHHELLVGERFELVLVFERAGELRVESEVRRPGAVHRSP